MTLTRRAFAAGIGAAIAACRRAGDSDESPAPSPIADPLEAGARWLAARSAPEGAWCSDVYGAFKDGWSLTPLATLALLAAGTEPVAARAGAAWLAIRTKDGRVETGRIPPAYPVYTDALAVRALSHPEAGAPAGARDAFLIDLRARQLTSALGWRESDAHYGGWGYATVIPRKPAHGAGVEDAFLESNLSATAFALDALATAGVSTRDPSFAAARVFVERQQNEDGGFFFIPDDDVRNKAGSPDPDARPRRFHSYGTMTADGLRSLLRCGLTPDHPRVAAAAAWLRARFDAARHPGTYRNDREEVRDSAWFYWAAAAATAFRMLGEPETAAPLVPELRRRQRADGSWANELIAVREDDPVVATSFALLALAALR